jgi:predicted DNA binding protein
VKRLSIILNGVENVFHPTVKPLLEYGPISSIEMLAWSRETPPTAILYYFHTPFQSVANVLCEQQMRDEWSLVKRGSGTFGLVIHSTRSQSILARTNGIEGVIELPPIVFQEDGTVSISFAGTKSSLDRLISDLQQSYDIEIEGYGTYHGPRGWNRVTSRQYQALETAVEVGYYDIPRTGTMVDIADELECSESTASEHLRKAQSSVIKDFIIHR